MPFALRGGVANLPDGTPICFAFNQGTCPFTPSGNPLRCKNGAHVCCAPSCGQAHTFSEHPR
eukprot:49424-Amphidinium_carterae.1